jgi:ADP-ribosylglycohydrolase
MNEDIKDKVKGIIFGQAIGDALGLGTEFLTKKQVAELYPDGYDYYDQMVRDKHRKRWAIGSWTDDTDQFLCVLDSLIENQTVDELDIAKRFKHWLDSNGMGVGQTPYKVLNLPQYEKQPKKGAKLIWKIKKKSIAPNGGLMRNSIVGTYKFWDTDEVIRNSISICELTHYDPRCKDSCAIVSSLIAAELNSQPISWDELNISLDGFDKRIKEYTISPNDKIENLRLDESNSLGYTLKALNAGVWSYYNSNNFRESLLKIILEGGDADTNGCIVGSLLGAKFGFKSIPSQWIDGLLGKDILEKKTALYLEKLEHLMTSNQ